MLTSEVYRLERRSEELGVSCRTLMENSGRAIADVVNERFPAGQRILVLAYHGNNGGDGFVAARYLLQNHTVHVRFLGDEAKLKENALANYRLLPPDVFAWQSLGTYDILIDALLGTGARGGLREPLRELSREWNAAPGYKVSVDVPTGLDPDTGAHTTDWFEPDLIVTFHALKEGLRGLRGKTVVRDIGIPEEA